MFLENPAVKLNNLNWVFLEWRTSSMSIQRNEWIFFTKSQVEKFLKTGYGIVYEKRYPNLKVFAREYLMGKEYF